jgi:MinD superfamily P-loop ATPase
MVVNIRLVTGMVQIAVVSGKGGTGKTLVATSLALSLKDVQLLDADVEEPNSSLFLRHQVQPIGKAEIPVPDIDKEICTQCGKCSDSCEYNALANLPGEVLLFEKICHGCGVCSAVCPVNAITERYRPIGTIYSGKEENLLFNYGELIVGEELATPVISKLKEYVKEDKEYVIIDSPPGSSCSMVETVIDTDFVLLIGEPTPFGFSDMKIVVEALRHLNKRFGVIINKDGIGNEEMEEYCKNEQIPILMKIPFDLEIAKQYSFGKTLVQAFPKWHEEFTQLAIKIKELV